MADNEAEPKAGGGLVKKLAIFGGGGILLHRNRPRCRLFHFRQCATRPVG